MMQYFPLAPFHPLFRLAVKKKKSKTNSVLFKGTSLFLKASFVQQVESIDNNKKVFKMFP